MDEFVIPPRFCGPPNSGNGGWTAGSLAERLVLDHSPVLADDIHPWIQVTLRTPPPLDTSMTVRHTGASTRLEHGDTLVAEAMLLDDPGPLDDPSTWVPGVSPSVAATARAAYPSAERHPFSGCFVCGPDREVGDGLRLFAGRVPGDDRVASPWTPPVEDDSPTASVAFTWAALDCPSAWADDLLARPMVLGRMSARILTLPRVDEEHVVVARVLRHEGRRTHTASALHTADGTVLAVAAHVWFGVDPATFG